MSDPGDPVGGGANLLAALALPAHDAARAMARRIVTSVLRRAPTRRTRPDAAIGRRLPAWTPLLLRWARKAVLVAGRVREAGARAFTTGPGAKSHWHFHAAAPRVRETGPVAARTADPSGARQQAGRTNPPSPDRAHRAPGASVDALNGGGDARRKYGAANVRRAARAGVDLVYIAAFQYRAGADAWSAPHVPRTGAIVDGPRWPGRVPAPVRWVRADGAGNAARTPQSHEARSLRTGDPASRGALAGVQLRRASGGAPAGIPITPRLMASRPPMRTAVAQVPGGQSPRAPARQRCRDWPPAACGQATRILPWAGWNGAVARAFASMPAPAARRTHGEQTWRARAPAAAVTATVRRNARSPGLADIGMRWQLELVWPAAATVSGHGPGPASAATTPPPSMRPTQAATLAAGHAGDSGGFRSNAIDPAWANRLADEVMRRLDYRARIERERLGC
nr:hypothetical protein [uncultured Duganella sp.]